MIRPAYVRLALLGVATSVFAIVVWLVHGSATAPRWPPPSFSPGVLIVVCNIVVAALAVGASFYRPDGHRSSAMRTVVAMLLLAVLVVGQLALDAWLYLLFGGSVYT
jgi:hypothetical protein